MLNIPSSGSEGTLCGVCAAAVPSIRRLLRLEPGVSDSAAPQPVFLDRIRSIQDKKGTCTLCKLVDHALAQSWPEVPLFSKAGVGLFCPSQPTRAVLVDANPVTDAWAEDVQTDGPRCLHVEVVLDGARPLPEDLGLSGGVIEARDLAGFKIGGNERSFQPEIRLMQQNEDGAGKEENAAGLARDIGPVCDSDRLRGWYRSCVGNSLHDENCAATRIVSDDAFDTPRGEPTPPPKLPRGARLIDVKEMKLVAAGQRHDVEYAALSYVWGNGHIQGLHTTQSNVKERQEDGSLRKAPLPKTISDAVELTRDLGILYLWVDSLCIVQDPGTEKDVQIEAMDKVYGLAALVIVAAAGEDSDAGLVGFRSTPRPEVSHNRSGKEKPRGQFTTHIRDFRLAVSPPPLQHILIASKWHSRAWTYQEWHFARRALIFTSAQVYFLCGSGYFCEDLVMESSRAVNAMWQVRSQSGPAATERHLDPGMELRRPTLGVSSGWAAYVDAVESFSPRVVRDPKDILKALAGVLGNLHRATRNRFVAGVSVGLLHDALLWVPVAGHLDRETGKRADFSVTRSNNPSGWRTGGDWLPSWSWAEWDGAVKYGVIPPGKSLVIEFKLIFTEPALGTSYQKPPDPNEDKRDGENSTSAADEIQRWITRLSRRFNKPRMAISRCDKATQTPPKPIVHANLLGHPLTELQTDRPLVGRGFIGTRPTLHGDNPSDGAEAEANRAGRPLSVCQRLICTGIDPSSQDGALCGPRLPPIYSNRCGLRFRATTATLQIAPTRDDLIGRADGIVDPDGRNIGVALLDQPPVPWERALRGFYNVEVVALSQSHSRTTYIDEGAALNLAGKRENEEPGWIGLLVVRKAGQGLEVRKQGEGESGYEPATTYIRIGVAQVIEEAWETWVKKRFEEVMLI
ncbi:hypothetical protein ACJ41O_007211 [Fusarium nematophilum]